MTLQQHLWWLEPESKATRKKTDPYGNSNGSKSAINSLTSFVIRKTSNYQRISLGTTFILILIPQNWDEEKTARTMKNKESGQENHLNNTWKPKNQNSYEHRFHIHLPLLQKPISATIAFLFSAIWNNLSLTAPFPVFLSKGQTRTWLISCSHSFWNAPIYF